MPLSPVSTGQNTAATQLNQLINLLTGVMTDQQTTLRHASSNPLILDRSDAAGIKGLAAIQRAAATKWWLGLDASDQMAILNAAGNAVNFGLTDLGAATIRAGLALGGALSGATTGVFSGEVTVADLKAAGVASLTNAQNSRFVGSWTTLGPPTGLTAAVADHGLDGNGNLWVCTVAGSPGTWRPRGIHLLDYQTPSGVGSITLGPNPLPSGYDWLEIIWQVRETGAVATDVISLRFNNISSNSYYRQRVTSNGATIAGSEGLGVSSGEMGIILGASVSDAQLAGVGSCRIYDYTDTTFKRTWVSGLSFSSSGIATGNEQLSLHGGLCNTTAALTRLDVLVGTGNYVTGSWIKLLGGVF